MYDYNIDEYCEDVLKLLSAPSVRAVVVDRVAEALQIPVTVDDVKALLTEWNGWMYDLTSNALDKRSYSNLDSIIRDDILDSRN